MGRRQFWEDIDEAIKQYRTSEISEDEFVTQLEIIVAENAPKEHIENSAQILLAEDQLLQTAKEIGVSIIDKERRVKKNKMGVSVVGHIQLPSNEAKVSMIRNLRDDYILVELWVHDVYIKVNINVDDQKKNLTFAHAIRERLRSRVQEIREAERSTFLLRCALARVYITQEEHNRTLQEECVG